VLSSLFFLYLTFFKVTIAELADAQNVADPNEDWIDVVSEMKPAEGVSLRLLPNPCAKGTPGSYSGIGAGRSERALR